MIRPEKQFQQNPSDDIEEDKTNKARYWWHITRKNK